MRQTQQTKPARKIFPPENGNRQDTKQSVTSDDIWRDNQIKNNRQKAGKQRHPKNNTNQSRSDGHHPGDIVGRRAPPKL